MLRCLFMGKCLVINQLLPIGLIRLHFRLNLLFCLLKRFCSKDPILYCHSLIADPVGISKHETCFRQRDF